MDGHCPHTQKIDLYICSSMQWYIILNFWAHIVERVLISCCCRRDKNQMIRSKALLIWLLLWVIPFYDSILYVKKETKKRKEEKKIKKVKKPEILIQRLARFYCFLCFMLWRIRHVFSPSIINHNPSLFSQDVAEDKVIAILTWYSVWLFRCKTFFSRWWVSYICVLRL